MDDITKDLLLRLGILLVGVIIAVLATTALTMGIENGEYKKISPRRLFGIRFFGGILGLLAGLKVMSDNHDTPIVRLLDVMWLAQGLAGIGGGEGWRQLTRFFKLSPPSDESKKPEA